MAYNAQGNATQKVVSVKLQANVQGFTAGMKKAKASVDDLTKADVPKAAKGYADLSNKAALAGAAIGVGLGVAVKRFAEFDATMSAVKANVGGTVEEMSALRNAAIQLGADSQFSANEAAQGINELGKAGLKSADILNGGLKGALDLAAAGQIGVADAAETTATALSQFKLGGDKAVHVADLLAAGANKAQGGVGDLGAALGQAGLVAAGMGVSIEETTGTLAAFAKAGLIGSDAGTSFKTMIQRLQAPIGAAAETLDKYNISAYDASGSFVGLDNVAGQLQDRFKDLTPEVRNNALAVIFGSDAIRAANVLYEQGAEGIGKWTDEVDQTGFAAKQAADLTDNLKGDIERLGGAFDSVLIQTGSSANGSLRTLVQGIQGLVEGVGRVPGPLLAAGGALTAIALLVPKGITSFRSYTATLDSVGLSFNKISARGPLAAKGMNAAAAAAKGLGAAFAVLAAAGAADAAFGAEGSRASAQELVKDFGSAEDAVAAFSARARTFAQDSHNWWSANDVKSFGDTVKYAFNPSGFDEFNNAWGSLLSTFGGPNDSGIERSKQSLADLDAALSAMVASGDVQGASATFDEFVAAAAPMGVTADELKAKLPGFRDGLAGVENATDKVTLSISEMADGMTLSAGQTDAVSAAMLTLGGSATQASDEVKALAETINSDMDAASKAFSSDLDVISKYDPEKAKGNVAKAAKASEKAEKNLQDVRERIAAKKKKTVADDQALEAATAKAAEARAAKVAAADEATGQSLTELYKDSVKTAKSFASDIQRVTEAGLDPAVVTKLLQAGPEQAGPILKEMLGKHGKDLIQMVNDSEAALAALNQNVVQQARLTAIAVNATTDEVAGHLDEASAIVKAKAASQGKITAEELAKKLKLPIDTVKLIAEEYGIALTAAVPPEKATAIKVTDTETARAALEQFHDLLDELPPAKDVPVTATGAETARLALVDFHNEADGLPPAKNTEVTTTGVPKTVAELLGVKNQLDSLRSKTITISTTYETFRQGERDSQDPVKKALGGAVYGPGSGTSDSIHALLSNGEHVWTAAEVAKLGGQSAMYALRAAVRQGRTPGFANGGAVAPQYAPPMSFMTMPSAGTSSITETNHAPVIINGGQFGPSLSDIEREAAARRRRDSLSPSRSR